MKCLILAAGYATRLYPLTENFPKPLLKVKGKTILDWLLDDIESTGAVNKYVLISNHKFAHLFEKWAKGKEQKIAVLDDGTTSNENRLGAVRDIAFAIEKLNINEDILVIAGDNLLDFSFCSFIEYAEEKKTSCIMRYFEEDVEKLKKAGVMKIDEDGRVFDMEEKPSNPPTNWCCPPFYYYTKSDLHFIKEGIESGCAVDAPGSFAAWLSKKTTVHAMEMLGKRYDIGDIESYEEVQKEYCGII